MSDLLAFGAPARTLCSDPNIRIEGGIGRPVSALRVVIAGGGVAALEAAFALRELAGRSITITIATSASEFVYRPLAVVRPFQGRPSYRLDLGRIARDLDATLVHDDAASVDGVSRVLVLASSRRLQFDALLIAIGARAEAVLTGGTLTPWDWGEGHAFRALLRSIENGGHRDVAFVVPAGLTWPLPLYELALLTRAFVEERGIAGVRLAIVTPERAPLQAFGIAVSAAVTDLLAARDIAFEPSEVAVAVEDGRLRTAGGRTIAADAAVALPIIQAQRLPGIAANDAGFITIDPYCRVAGAGDIFAAGDCTDQPVKQGGLAAQQADVAAGRARRSRSGRSIRASRRCCSLAEHRCISRNRARGPWSSATTRPIRSAGRSSSPDI